tara:strand:+ start:365 stop:577 length:213 start_codon:yes stop_codon:yes gene_type:complete
MLFFYLLVLTVVALIIIGGYDSTMRLVAFIDLNTRYAFLKMRMWFFKKRIERQLSKDIKEIKSKKEKPNV